MAKLSKSLAAICIIDFICIVFSLFFENSLLITLDFVIWLDIIIYCLQKLEDRVSLLVFSVAFFAFLIGRELLEKYKLHSIYVNFSEEINIHAERLLAISMVSLFFGYLFLSHVTIKKLTSKPQIDYDSSYYRIVRKVSKYLFIAALFIAVYSNIITIISVLRSGYLSIFLNNRYSNLIFDEISSMSKIAFWVFLATMPSKKECNKMMILFIINSALTLGSGSRTNFVVDVLLIFTYYVSRNKINSGGKKWFGKREFFICLIIAPVLMVAMVFVSIFRLGSGTLTGSFLDNITRFIYEQGTSINLIKRAKMYSDVIPKNRVYMLGATITYLKTNPVSQLLGLALFSGTNNAQHALQGYSMSHTLSYIAIKDMYLRGMGLGSSYIAEAFHDLGYIGVVLINFLYSAILQKAITFKNKGIWASSLAFIIMEGIITAPRGATDEFIVRIITPSCWVTLGLIYIIAKLYYSKFIRAKNA